MLQQNVVMSISEYIKTEKNLKGDTKNQTHPDQHVKVWSFFMRMHPSKSFNRTTENYDEILPIVFGSDTGKIILSL